MQHQYASRAADLGINILECMIVLVVAGIVSAAATPPLGTLIKNATLQSDSSELMNAVVFARNEAVKRGSRVILCRTADPGAAVPSCGGRARDWSTGWLIFVAQDADDDFDLGSDNLLEIGGPGAERVSLLSNRTADEQVIYMSDGTLNEAGSARYAICDERGEAYGHELYIGMVGRPVLTKGTIAAPIAHCAPLDRELSFPTRRNHHDPGQDSGNCSD